MEKRKNINKLFLDWHDSEVHTTRWFAQRGISQQLAYKYYKMGLLEKLGGGAYKKAHDKRFWPALLAAAQMELKLPIHLGARTALELQGVSHFVNLGDKTSAYVFVRENIRMPVWIVKCDEQWKVKFLIKKSDLFSKDQIGITPYERDYLKLNVSSRERAILELIYVEDFSYSFELAENYMEGLTALRFELMQELLEECKSIKVKRVFLYLAQKLGLPICQKIDRSRIDLGSGKRLVVKGGVLDKEYLITIPEKQEEMKF